ncbi:MAG: tetratricopeptide repeat protein [Planctomycetota bacterium]
MSFLRRLFRIGRSGRRKGDGAPVLARELESTIAEAERLVAGGRYEEAIQVAEAGLRRFPTAGRLRSVIQYVRRVGANKRLSQLKKIIDERKDERAYRELVTLHLDLGNRGQALQVAVRYSDEFPDTAEAHVHVGEVYLARYFGELFARDAWSAIEGFERALELDPKTIRARVLLGLLYYGIGAVRHSSNELGEVLRLDPANTRITEFREQVLGASPPGGEEDVEMLLDDAEDNQTLPNDPGLFPGGRRYAVENRGGTLSPKLFAAAAAGIGKRLRIEQLAAVGTGGRPLAVAGENKESFVRLACRIDATARRAGRHMNFGTMRRFMVEGKFGRIVLVPAGNCAVAARAPRSVSTDRIAEGLEMVVTASRAQESQEVE